MSVKLPKFRYSRPSFLQLKNDDEILVSADHQVRPIILPRDLSSLPWRSGYAECINAGKSKRNEDQASSYQDVLVRHSSLEVKPAEGSDESGAPAILNQLPWTYFGVFDGHAGPGVAIAAANQLHDIIAERLQSVADLLISLEFERAKEDKKCEPARESTKTPQKEEAPAEPTADAQETAGLGGGGGGCGGARQDEPVELAQNGLEERTLKLEADREKRVHFESADEPAKLPAVELIEICRNNISVDSLVIGALESAFWTMDALIAHDKQKYKMAGGCTAIVGVFTLGKLFICNAGDSRAIIIKGNQVIPMSYDFTPTSERERILRLGQQRPEFLGNEFTCLEFIKRPTRKDVGKQMLYRDAFMTGWSIKQVTYDDLKLPLVSGIGKRSRVLATIGVTRGFGDHELRAHYGSLLIKPFLTPEPETRIIQLDNDDALTSDDVLVIGTDGLWDVVTNVEVAHTIKNSFVHFPESTDDTLSRFRYVTAAQDLVIKSRGNVGVWGDDWRIDDGRPASLDDIAVFVIPLKQYRDEYEAWKELRAASARQFRENSGQ